MEHPEKALFDEVRGLRTQLEESRQRITQIENDYKEKVIYLEKRCLIDERCEEKLNEYEDDIKDVIYFIVGNKEYPYFRSTFEKNIYIAKFLKGNETNIRLDMEKKEFKLLMTIVRTGNNYYKNRDKLGRKKFKLEDKLNDESTFASYIKQFFEEDSFKDIINDYSLNVVFPPTEDIFEDINLEKEYTVSESKYKATHITDILNKHHSGPMKAFFLNYNGTLEIKLKESVRVNRIYIRPFTENGNTFTASNGHTYTMIYCSLDGKYWSFLNNVPSTYGNFQNNNITEINFNPKSFKYLKFVAHASYLFSLSYIGFNK